jgi:hypothetical protein
MPAAKKAKAKPAAHKTSARAKVAAKKPAARKPAPAKHSTKTMRSSGGRESDYSQYSGKFTVRLPRSLHQALVDRAEKEGVSLNLFVTNALSRTVAGAKKK